MIGFGTGGWRAVIGEEFTKANVQLLKMCIRDRFYFLAFTTESGAQTPYDGGYSTVSYTHLRRRCTRRPGAPNRISGPSAPGSSCWITPR